MAKSGVQKSGEDAVQRIDIWLWHARFFKTRSISSQKIRSGKARVNGALIRKSSVLIRVGDMLTFQQSDIIRVIKVTAISDRRGPAPEAASLFDDHTPIIEKDPAKPNYIHTVAVREMGSGRPTKAERRATDKLREIN